MNFFKRNPVFYSILFALLLGALTGVWYLSKAQEQLKSLKATYQTKSDQYNRYVVAEPSPTKSNLKALTSNYSELYDVYDRAMHSLNLNTYDRDGFFGSTPTSRADWSFEINRFVSDSRYHARRNSVELPDGIAFGFSDYVRGGPPPEKGEQVHRQIRILAPILKALFDSGIESFVSVRRGLARQPTQATGRRASRERAAYNENDEFLISPKMSCAIPEILDTYAFELTFRGQSISLRRFLNTLVESSAPYTIRDVRVELTDRVGVASEMDYRFDNPFARTDSEDYSLRDSSVPIIAENVSLFKVTIEFLDLKLEAPEPDDWTAEGEGDV